MYLHQLSALDHVVCKEPQHSLPLCVALRQVLELVVYVLCDPRARLVLDELAPQLVEVLLVDF